MDTSEPEVDIEEDTQDEVSTVHEDAGVFEETYADIDHSTAVEQTDILRHNVLDDKLSYVSAQTNILPILSGIDEYIDPETDITAHVSLPWLYSMTIQYIARLAIIRYAQ